MFRALLFWISALVTLERCGANPVAVDISVERNAVQVTPAGETRTAQKEEEKKPLFSQVNEPVLHLSPYNFAANVLRDSDGDQPKHWVVYFCPPWWSICKALEPTYHDQAVWWQGQLNHGLLTLQARFATVDCATYKVLCNEQAVEDYPTIVHYHRGARLSQWTSNGRGAVSLQLWLEAQLAEVPKNSTQAARADSLLSLAQHALARDVLLVFLATAFVCWAFASGVAQPREKAPPAPRASAAPAPQAEAEVSSGGAVRRMPKAWAERAGSEL